MNSETKLYIGNKYSSNYLILPKKEGSSHGFILEKNSSSSLKRVYFKSDPGFLVDHFVLSIFARVSVKVPESKIHYIKNGKSDTNANSSNFYLSTNGMDRSYQKNGILKSQVYKNYYHTKEFILTTDQINQFRTSLAKARLLIYIFGLSDLHKDNLGYVEKSWNSSQTFKLGIVDFATPVTWPSDLFEMFSQSHFVEELNSRLSWVSLPGAMKDELTLDEYKQAFYKISHPTLREFDDNGYLVSNSSGARTEFERVVENVFNNIKKECLAFKSESSSIDEESFKNLISYLSKVENYKNVILCRFQDAEAIINGRSIHRFITTLIKEIIIPSYGLLLFLRITAFGAIGSILCLALFLFYCGATQKHLITPISVKGLYQTFCDAYMTRGPESGNTVFLED